MTSNAELMYDTSPPHPNRSRIILGDGSTKNVVDFIGNIDLIFHSHTECPATIYSVNFTPGLGFNIFPFHVL